ncbi:MAG TPA: glycosyltransferase [Mycobacteriales bacterium]|jgi:undecaprenyl-phosphate 4-deoxy-4-formamido-L-arabinose transferase|nr:glycosyltransferase [Mycobacteriales bacterium]
MSRLAVVVPVHGNEATLEPLVTGLEGALAGRDWRVRLVVDASPDGSADVAARLQGRDARVRVTVLTVNVGQHAALVRGLEDEPDADAWVCMDADLQDPPDALPALLERLASGGVDAVFAGRRGAYESVGRRLTGALHRRALALLTGLPPDAGAFLALGPRARGTVLAAGAPSVVVALAGGRLRVASLPVVRQERAVGASAWTSRARLAQSARTLAWAVRHRAG